KLNVGTRTDLVISDGAITITRGYHRVDTEGSAPTDDLDTIHGGQPGDILILMQQATGRKVTIKNGTGNIYTFDGQDIEMNSARSAVILLKRTETEWIVLR